MQVGMTFIVDKPIGECRVITGDALGYGLDQCDLDLPGDIENVNGGESLPFGGAMGSIEPGKLANLAILRDNPVAVDPLKIKDIEVWGTVMEGRKLAVGYLDQRASLDGLERSGPEHVQFAKAAVGHAVGIAALQGRRRLESDPPGAAQVSRIQSAQRGMMSSIVKSRKTG